MGSSGGGGTKLGIYSTPQLKEIEKRANSPDINIKNRNHFKSMYSSILNVLGRSVKLILNGLNITGRKTGSAHAESTWGGDDKELI
jgi:hypothetical protein